MRGFKFGPIVRDTFDAAAPLRRRVEVGFEPKDIWVGMYVVPTAYYICPLPMILIRVARGPAVRFQTGGLVR